MLDNVDVVVDVLADFVDVVCAVSLAAVGHVFDFVVSPQTVVANLALGVMLYAIDVDGCLGRRRLAVLGVVEELVVYVLWLTVEHGLRTVFAVWICLTVYEKIVRPRIQVQESTVLLADVGVEEALTQLGVKCDSVTDEQDASGATRRISCVGLRLVAFGRSNWALRQRKQPHDTLKLDNITLASDTCNDLLITKRLQDLGIEPERCLYLAMDVEQLTVILIAEDHEKRDAWLIALQQLLGFRIHDVRYAWLLKLCAEAATGNGIKTTGSAWGSSASDGIVKVGRNVEFEQALDMLNRAGRSSDPNYARELFKTFASVNGILMRKLTLGADAKQLTWEQFLAFFSCAANRPEINDIYDKIIDRSKKVPRLSCTQFHEFVVSVQKENVNLNETKRWIAKCEPVLQSLNMSYIGFASYILDDAHSIFRRQCRRVYQDMTQPLSHYFIATSHNTYLTKDQLASKSSVDMYVNAFKRGCKCVELDIWDGPNGDPMIYHGYTLTSKILAKDVIETIRQYAFCVSPYPVILSFENHCSPDQQRTIAQYLVDILGDMLYTKPMPPDERYLPSPEDLKGYILVKTQKLKADSDEPVEELYEDDIFEYGDDDLTDVFIRRQPSELSEGDDATGSDSVSSSDGIGDDVISLKSEADEDEFTTGDAVSDRKKKSIVKLKDAMERMNKMNREKEKAKPSKIAQEFSDLVVYCQPTGIKTFELSKQTGAGKYYEMVSLGERRASRLARDEATCFARYNCRQLSRTYPAGSRIDSSNYDPIPLWNVGCQMVALNYQTGCIEMQINQAMFANNGLCGYVLKPEFLREEDTNFDPRVSGDPQEELTLRIIGAHQIPYKNERILKSERHLCVQVRVLGVDADIQCDKTSFVKNNGRNPVWNSTLQFKLHVPELAFVMFTVLAKNVFIAQYTIPYRCMQQGYRRVPLLNKASEPFPYSYLFVHVECGKSHEGNRQSDLHHSPGMQSTQQPATD